ncbi:MAG: hypothetical protein ACFB50_03875 [Rubrobacteraceae bacterium]
MTRIPLPEDINLDGRTLDFIGTLPNLNIVRMLARTGIAPEIYTAVAAVFNEAWFPAVDREVMLFRICWINQSTYEIHQHMAYGGLDEQTATAIMSDGMSGLSEWHKALCRMCDEITVDAKLGEASVSKLVEHYGGYNEACKAIFVMSWFNMLTRYVDSTGIPVEEGDDPYKGIAGPASVEDAPA